MKRNPPKHPHASRDRVGALRYTAGQRRQWAAYAKAKGRTAEAASHLRKAEAALRTLGHPI